MPLSWRWRAVVGASGRGCEEREVVGEGGEWWWWIRDERGEHQQKVKAKRKEERVNTKSKEAEDGQQRAGICDSFSLCAAGLDCY
jgi:hypothetical protein